MACFLSFLSMDRATRAVDKWWVIPGVLFDGIVEYEDETPATTSQMAKDVVEFLNWAAEPEMDDRKRMGMKVVVVTSVLWALSVVVKRYKWAWLKSRKTVYDPPKETKTRH